MKNKKRFTSSDLSTAAFLRCTAIGVLVGALFLCLLMLSFSLLIVLTKHLPSEYALIILKAFIIISGVVCGYISAFILKRKGLLVGSFSSFVFGILLFIYKCVNTSFDFEVKLLVDFIIIILCGAIGGVLGVNNDISRKKLYK